MNRRDAVLLTAIQTQGDRLGLAIQSQGDRLDLAIHAVNARLDAMSARLDTVIDVLAQLRGDLTGHVADRHRHDDD